MLTSRIIPCLDVSHGRVVKGVRFQGLRDAGDPAERASLYEAQGADEIVILDVSATPEGRGHQHETVRRVRAGLSHPAHRSAAACAPRRTPCICSRRVPTRSPSTRAAVTQARSCWARSPPASAANAACSRSTPHGATAGSRSWSRAGARARASTRSNGCARASARGAGEILLTSWDRDGTRSGYDLELTRAAAEAVDLPVIASGGADTSEHILEAFKAGADAVLAASIFHDGDLTPYDVKLYLQDHGLRVRP